MATERNIFEQYCDVAINEILEKGYMRSDFDWDVYRHGREIKYIFRIYDKPDENMIAYFVVLLKLKDNQIIRDHIFRSDTMRVLIRIKKRISLRDMKNTMTIL